MPRPLLSIVGRAPVAVASREPSFDTRPRKERTILSLIAEMEAMGIRYVVMRNHEAFPAFGHDADFAIYPDDIPAWQGRLIEIAREQGWQALTRCHHWDSEFAHQSPKSFLLYSTEPDLDFLCVDLFHGATLWGLPLYTIDDVLGDSVRDPRGFMKMSPARETLLRILQVDALVGHRREPAKVEGYTARIRQWWPECGEQTLELGSRLLGPTFRSAVEALFAGDTARFKRRMRVARLWFLARHAFRNPFLAFRQAKARSHGRLREAGADQCGFVIACPGAGEEQRELIRDGLTRVALSNAVREWTEEFADTEDVTSRERAVMEMGSVAIKWRACDDAFGEIDAAALNSSVEAAERVYDLLIERHEVLWRRA